MRQIRRAPASHNNNNFFFGVKDFLFQKKGFKGQWFIISAVVVSSVFFALSLMMKDYFTTDSSYFAGLNNDHYFYNVVQQFDNVVAQTPTNVSCVNLTTNLNELKAVAEKELASRGMFSVFEYKIINSPCSLSGNNVTLDFLVASQDEILYNFSTYTSASQVIGAV